MKKIVSFRTDTENKAALIAKASELGIPLSEFLDQITSESVLETESFTDSGNSLHILERESYLRKKLFELQEVINGNNLEGKNYREKEKILNALILMIEFANNGYTKMLAEQSS
jgi:hypothetical protein